MKTFIRFTILSLPVLFCMQAVRAQEHHGALTDNGSLYFRAEAVNNYIMANADKGEFYYYIHLQGVKKQVGGQAHRIPLNLSLVIDRSGSMSGEKLENTKKAVEYIIRQLDESDIISIVIYSDQAEVLVEPQRLENKEEIIGRVKGIISNGSTNLEGGIRKGYSLLKSAKKIADEEMVNRMFLLSDGIANVGITDPETLGGITNAFFEEEKISISTFGVGLDYNEDLMAKIALQGGGMYYFINSPEDLSGIFMQELKGISQVVAKNTIIEIRFPEDMVQYEKTYSYHGVLKNNVLKISFNDLFSEEQKSVLIKFSLRKQVDSPIELDCRLTYTNSNSDSMVSVTSEMKSQLDLAKNENQYNSGFNKAASEGYALQVAGEIYGMAVQAADDGDYKLSKDKIKEAKDVLECHFKNVGDNSYLKGLYKDLCDYEGIIDDLKNMSRTETSYHIKKYKSAKFRTIACPAF
ncbi:MAG: VWA domain-containing protein [Bacteroidota bacterium]